MRKFFLTATVATIVAASGCGATNQCRRGGCENYYGSTNGDAVYGDGAGYVDGAYVDGAEYGDGAVYGGAQYPVYGDGQVVVGPQMLGETIGAPAGEPLPGPAN